MTSGKRNRTKVAFPTADQLDEQADAVARDARLLPEGEARRNALHHASQLRVYATMKRALAPRSDKVK
jgi:hypothetical protein